MTRRALIIYALAMVLGACGSGPCASDYVGTWAGSGDSITFNDQCSFSYSAAACASSGTYGAPLGSSGTSQVTITSSTGSGCLGVGTTACAYSVSGTTLTFDCGAGASSYTKQ